MTPRPGDFLPAAVLVLSAFPRLWEPRVPPKADLARASLPAGTISSQGSHVLFNRPTQDGEPPDRIEGIGVTYTEHTWWLVRWEDSQAVCSVPVDHEGFPTPLEVLAECGRAIQADWLETDVCAGKGADSGASECSGLYLHLAATAERTKTVEVHLPPPSMLITLDGCIATHPGEPCPTLPKLRLLANEPIPNEVITWIHLRGPGIQVDCPYDHCAYQLAPTSEEGIELEFWADSTFGGSSEAYSARVRVLPVDMVLGANAGGWYVDVLSDRWWGGTRSSCAEVWDALPTPGGPPAWLRSAQDISELGSDETYALLAGRLITAGAVDVSECPSAGLVAEGVPDACGMAAAEPIVKAWQDRFDQAILAASNQSGVPARLLKRVFAQESQFWPGAYGEALEFGLGRLTDQGADTTLLWNLPFYDAFCPLVLEQRVCERGYAQLAEADRAMLRGALVLQARADCAECDIGVDLTKADVSVMVFAETLQANCEQVGRMVYNTTRETPGKVASYEDLWRLTLASYNGGPGCVSSAMKSAWRRVGTLTWSSLMMELPETCVMAGTYVDAVSGD